LLKADYSQIELRLLAHFSQDKNLLQSFAEKKDIHTSTAMQVFNKTDVESVSKDERRYAKTINFGIIYGQSAFSLAKELGITGGEAKEYIRRYFAQFPEVQTFIQTTHEQAIANGYVETLYGRKVYLKQINSKNHAVKQGQLRLAVNAILQGSAADIIKVAMIRIADYLNNGCDGGFDSAMLLQVHDELVFQLADAEVTTVTPVIQELMVKDFPLDLVVNI
jgi:DNA polymerase-1